MKNPHYNQNYTREEIDEILAKIKSCIEKNKHTISQNENQRENIDFISKSSCFMQTARKKP